jgi:hypothetical protein
MMRACQGFNGVFGTLALAGAVSTGVLPVHAAAAPAADTLSVDVVAWSRRPYPDVVAATPELAACHQLAPGSWAAAQPPSALGVARELADAVRGQLAGVVDAAVPLALTVVVAENEAVSISAVASGATCLLLVPSANPWTVADAAREVIAALARSTSSPAARDPRCSEPLLALAEALATAGSLTLAQLPPELRPVSEWLEADDAEPLLADFAAAALDRKEPWSSRRVRLQHTALTSKANAQLLTAAALVVEAYGDARRARREPYDLLLAWRNDRDDRFPAMPGVLRRALAEPAQAGLPTGKYASEAALVDQHALQRAVESGSLPAGSRLDGQPLALRAVAAAHARAQGSGQACARLLAGTVPGALRTGCRADERPAGFVVSRPRPQGGFEVVSVSASDELVLLRWPRWILSPLVIPAEGLLLFIDDAGVWAVVLDSGAAPRLLAGGGFRLLAPGPAGSTIAAVRWPTGSLATIALDGGVSDLAVDAGCGVAWLAPDLLLAAGREAAVVVSLTGESRPFPAALPCPRALARAAGALWVAAGAPCETGIARVPLDEGAPALALPRGETPGGIVATSGDGLLFSDPEGVFRWRSGESAVRVGGGISAGPG